jgi:Ca-activated chloride channel family protein
MTAMHLAYPHVLWLLLLLPSVGYWWLRKRRRATLPYSDSRMLEGLPSGSGRWAEMIGLGVRLLVAGLLIVALARPRWPDETTRIPARSLAVMMVLDVSGSMAEPYGEAEEPPHPQPLSLKGERGEQRLHAKGERGETPRVSPFTRLDAAKRAFRLFVVGGEAGLTGRPDDLIGLVTFAALPENIVPPTLSHSTLLRFLEEAEPIGRSPDSDTNIGDAMSKGVDLLERVKPEERVMILLSDGEHNVRPEVVKDALKPQEAAQIAAGRRIRVHTIYVGPKSETEPTEGEKALREVAALTGGRSFQAHDIQGLVEVCNQIDQLERTRIESFQYYRYFEVFPWLGLACLVLLLGLRTMESTRWLRVP